MSLGTPLWAGLVVWVGVWAVGVNGQADGSFWWLENTTAAPESTPEPSRALKLNCQCVPFYQCVDGVITTSGVGLIDIRASLGNSSKPVTNVESCPDILEICCALPNDTSGSSGSSGSSGVTSAPVTTTTLPPDTPCDCVPLIECNDPNRLVSDGKGNTSLALFDSSVSHSKCRGAFEVCCVPEVTALPMEGHDDDDCICVPSDLCGDDGHVITDGTGLINPRFGPNGTPTKPLDSGFCPDRQDVCCLPPPPTTTPPTASHAACGWRNAGGVRVSVFLALLWGWFGSRW